MRNKSGHEEWGDFISLHLVGRTPRDVGQALWFTTLSAWASRSSDGSAGTPRPTFLKFLSAYLILSSAVLLFTAGCGSPRIAYRPDAEIERNAAAAKNAYSSGSMERASVFYQKALDRARLADQPAEIARLAYNLAACRAQMQKYDEALELLDEAQFESAKAGADLPEAVLLRAEILRCLGRTNEALATAKSGLDTLNNLPRAARDQNGRIISLQLQLFLAELANDQGDGKLALQELDKLNPDLLKSSDPVVQAKAVQTRGRALLLEKRPAEAAGCFDEAAALYQKARRYFDMAAALQNAGDAYVATNKRSEAFDRHFRAARSMFLYGDNVKAQESFNKASELAKETGDKQMLSALARLENAIRPTPRVAYPSKEGI